MTLRKRSNSLLASAMSTVLDSKILKTKRQQQININLKVTGDVIMPRSHDFEKTLSLSLQMASSTGETFWKVKPDCSTSFKISFKTIYWHS